MSEKLSWNEIRTRYKDEWVQLVDVNWDLSTPDPQAGVVRVHHRDKKEFKKLLANGEKPKRAALLYTGELFPADAIYSANLHHIAIER
ncbi:MAG: hypothetical protein IT291_10435 [Deltaproteobacteria bacterium]|nr:hypothetical protein [Deltaproteobacteria bacterium]